MQCPTVGTTLGRNVAATLQRRCQAEGKQGGFQGFSNIPASHQLGQRPALAGHRFDSLPPCHPLQKRPFHKILFSTPLAVLHDLETLESALKADHGKTLGHKEVLSKSSRKPSSCGSRCYGGALGVGDGARAPETVTGVCESDGGGRGRCSVGCCCRGRGGTHTTFFRRCPLLDVMRELGL